MSENRGPAPSAGRGPGTVVEVLRIELGKRYHLRLLSASYSGLFVHWIKDRPKGHSEYCRGNDCPAAVHRLPRLWRGYGAVECYDRERKLWVPCVLEMTEHLELDFRGLWRAGQIWEVFKVPGKKGKRAALQGVYVEDSDPATLPAAFPLLPVLQHLFHCETFDLACKNPLPPRPIVHASEAPAPRERKPETLVNGVPDDDEKRRMRELLRERLGRVGQMPTTNGKGGHP